jgi:hypothetical protein
METKNKSPRNKTLKQRVRETQLYKELNHVQQEMISKSQNVIVIERALYILAEAGIKQWQQVSKYSPNNEAVILELYANNLEVEL